MNDNNAPRRIWLARHLFMTLGVDAFDVPPALRHLRVEYVREDSERAAQAERIRICAYLGYDTTYSDDFCVRCSHCPSNCECAEPVYMAGWAPDETLKALKVALFTEDQS